MNNHLFKKNTSQLKFVSFNTFINNPHIVVIARQPAILAHSHQCLPGKLPIS